MDEGWQRLLGEVREQHSGALVPEFTSLCQMAGCDDHVQVEGIRYPALVSATRGPRHRVVYLGEVFPGVYFTQREAHCALLLLNGATVKLIAKHLGLSYRTVEYYMDNIKAKIQRRRKGDVIAAILKSDFLKNLRYIASHEICNPSE